MIQFRQSLIALASLFVHFCAFSRPKKLRFSVRSVVQKSNRPLLFALSLLLSLPNSHAADLAYTNLNDERIALSNRPYFVITSKSESDLNQVFRCATRIESLPNKPHWLIDFNWPQPESIKRATARKLLKSDFLKKHATVLDAPASRDALIALIGANGSLLWSCHSYPSDEDWKVALDSIPSSDHR